MRGVLCESVKVRSGSRFEWCQVILRLRGNVPQAIEDDQTVTRGMGNNPLSPAFASPEQEVLLESLASTAVAFPERIEKLRRRGGRDFRKSVAYREALEMLKPIP